jgi:serine/threonine protein kinase
MFRIVEDDMPPLPEGCSELLEDFLRQCFNKDPSKRPTAEDLCEHEWLKVTWVPGKDPRQQDTIPFIRRISTDVKQSSPSIARYIAQIAKSPRSEMGDSDDGPKPTPDLSTPSLEGESWDEEASIMVDPDLQLVGFIYVSLLSLGRSTAA